ncbi:ATP-binding protein [Thioclava indica]|nr:ATP-binding protein [Thioclava indica]
MQFLHLFTFRHRVLFATLLGSIGVAVVIVMSIDVARDMRLLDSASSDNVQYALSQTEVEYLEYELLLARAVHETAPDLKRLRQRFDIFYSRANTLQDAPTYARVRELPYFSAILPNIRSFLESQAQIIDSPDPVLQAAIPKLAETAAEFRSSIRLLSNSGLQYFAQDSDQHRLNVAITLTRMAAVVTFLVAALLVLVFYLVYLNAQNIRRRREVDQTSNRMKIVTGTALDAVVVCDLNGRILDFNAAAEQIFGHSAKTAIGADLGELIVPDKYRAAHDAGMARMRAHGEKHVTGKGRVKLEAKRATGELFPVEFAIQAAQTDEGEIFIAFLRDISHRVQAEQDLVAARDRALSGEKAKTDFLATMSHEIRTPLNGLLGNLALLRDTRLSAKQTRYIDNMDTSGKLLMSHISDVLDITKYDAGKLRLRPVAMNISALLQDIVDNQSGAASANNTVLEWGWRGEPADWIRADQDRIQHVLMNIIGNAVKFTHDGRVSLEIEMHSDQQSTAVMQITVRDTGIGMDAELQAQIFDDFMTGDSSYIRTVGGTGLGLGIAKRFVTALGGTIEVQSEKGTGSQFRIRLPVELIAAPESVVKERKQPTDAAPCHILLVEDNEINRFVAREMLTAAGHKVSEAHNGQIAVDMAQTQHFDLILMDISMPVKDGRKATREIRAGHGASARTPIVALTANAMAEEQEAFLLDGMNDILTKPLTREGLNEAIVNHVAARPDTPDTPMPATEPETKSHIATRYLDDLRETLGVEALDGLLARFMREVDETIGYLDDYTDQPLAEIAKKTHQIAGSAASLGAVELRGKLLAIETAAKAADMARLALEIDALPAIWTRTRETMQAERRAAPRD